MIGLDTNVLVRYVVQDDADQSARATELIETHCRADNPGWIDSIVLCELVWVLESAYGYEREIVASVLRQLLGTADIVVENPTQAWSALRAYESGPADFADYLVGLRNHGNGCESTYTFDRRASASPWHRAVS
jgi:predicted nucleic-acid-binding protein